MERGNSESKAVNGETESPLNITDLLPYLCLMHCLAASLSLSHSQKGSQANWLLTCFRLRKPRLDFQSLPLLTHKK